MDDDPSAVANTMTDMQANASAYNYNWYQVGYRSVRFTALKKNSPCKYSMSLVNYGPLTFFFLFSLATVWWLGTKLLGAVQPVCSV